jgi:hypothetical protein
MDFENIPYSVFEIKEVQSSAMFTFENSFPVLRYPKKDAEDDGRLLKIDVKCMLNQEFLIWKERN